MQFVGVFLLGATEIASGQTAVPVGEEFRINTYTTGWQYGPKVSHGPDGSFVVVWGTFADQDGSFGSVQGQRYDAAGEKIGGEFQINTYTTGRQGPPTLSHAGNGSFVVTWEDSQQDGSGIGIHGQRFDATGSPVGEEFQVNTFTTGRQNLSRVSQGADGSFVVVWQSDAQDGSLGSVRGRRYDAGGEPVAGEFQINSYTTGYQTGADVSHKSDGSFAVVWVSRQDGSGSSIQGQRFDSAANSVGGEFQVNSYTTGSQFGPRISHGSDDSFVVVWVSYGQDGSVEGIHGQRYDAAGDPAGGEFQINSYTTDDQDRPAVAHWNDGSFTVVWHSYSRDNGLSASIRGREFNLAGDPIGEEFQINTFTTSFQRRPHVSHGGGLVVVWDSFQDGDSYSVHGQRFQRLIFADGFETGDTSRWSSP